MATINEIRRLYPEQTSGLTDEDIITTLASDNGLDPSYVAGRVGYQTPKSDMGKEFYAGGNRYLAGMGHIAGALGMDSGTEYAKRKEDRANMLQALSNAPHSWEEMQVGDKDKGILPYIGQFAASSAPYLAEGIGWAAADAATGGALTPALVARGAQAVARSGLAKNAVERAAAAAVSEAPSLGWKAAMDAGTGQVANNIARTAMVPAVTYPSSLGDVLSNQYEQSGGYNLPAAAALAVPYAGANAFGLEGAALRRGLPFGELVSGIKNRGLRTVGQGGLTALSEGGNEVVQEIANQYGRQSVDPAYNPWGDQAMRNYRESFIGGALLGGIPGSASGAMSRYKAPIGRNEQVNLLSMANTRDETFGQEGIDYSAPIYNGESATQGQMYDMFGAGPGYAPTYSPVSPATSPTYNPNQLELGVSDLFGNPVQRAQTPQLPNQRTNPAGDQQTLDMFYPNGAPTYNADAGDPRTEAMFAQMEQLRAARERAAYEQQYSDMRDQQVPAQSTDVAGYPANWVDHQVETMPRNYQLQLPLGLGLSYQNEYAPAGEQAAPQVQEPNPNQASLFGPRGGVTPEADAASTQRRMLVKEQARLSQILGYTPSVKATPVIVAAEQAHAQGAIDQATFDQVINATVSSPAKAAALLQTALQQGVANESAPAPLDASRNQGERVEPVGSNGAVPVVGEQPDGRGADTGAPVGRRGQNKPVGDGTTGQRVENVAQPEQVAEKAPQADAPEAAAESTPAPKTEVVTTGNTARDIVNRHDISTDEGVMSALRELMKNPDVPQKLAYDAENALEIIDTAEDEKERSEEIATVGRKWLQTIAEHKTNKERKTRRVAKADEVPTTGTLAEQLGAANGKQLPENAADLLDRGWKDVHEAIAGAKNLGEALRTLLDFPHTAKWQKVLINALLKSKAVSSSTLVLNPDFVLSKVVSDGVALGHFDPDSNTTYLHAGGGIQSLLHEAVHAAVFNKLESDAAFRKQISNLYLKAKRNLGEDHYGMTDIQEFVSEAFTNPEFQKALAGIPSENKTTLWQAFVDAVRSALQLFGVQRNLLDDVISAASEHFADSGAVETKATGKVAERAVSAEANNVRRASSIDWKENAKDFFRRLGLNIVPLDQMVRLYKNAEGNMAKFGEALYKYQKHLNERGATARKLVESVRPLTEAWTAMGKVEGQKLTTALQEATLNEAWGDVAFDHEDNKHLQTTDKELLAENRKAYEKSRAAYDALSEDGKKIYRKILGTGSEWLKKEYQLRSRAARDTYLPLIEGLVSKADFAQLQGLYANDNIGVSETRKQARALLKGNTKALDLVKELDAMVDDQIGRLREMNGPYFPLMRFGDFVTVYKSDEFAAKLDEYAAATEAAKQFRADNFAEYDAAVNAVRDAQKEYRKRPSPAGKAALDAAKAEQKRLKEALKSKSDELNKLKGGNAKLLGELSKMAQDENHYIFEKHETSGGAKRSAEMIRARKENGKADHFASADYLNDALPTSRSFVNKLEARLKQKFGEGTPQYRAAVAALNTTFLETTHDRSSLKRMFLTRKKVPGYSQDGQRTFASFIMQGAHRLSSIEHFVPMQTALDEAAKVAHTLDRGSSGRLTQASNEVLRRFELDMQYSETPVMDWITKLNHVWTLGISPAYLLQNVSQTFLISAPVMAARHSLSRTSNALWQAWGDSYKIISEAVGKQGGRYTVDIDALNLPDAEKRMLKDLFHAGLADILQEHDVSELASGNQAAAKVNKVIDKVNWISRQIELHNRLTTALAAFRLEMAKTGSETAANEYAQNVVSDTQINYSDENSSRFLKKNSWMFAKLFGQFKKYQIGMATTIATNAYKAFKGDKEALRTTLGLLTTHLATTGTMGLSVYFPIKAVATVLAGILGLAGGDDDDFDFDRWYKNWLADTFGQDVGDVLARGVPAMAGLDFTSSLGQGNLFNPLPFYRGGDDTPKAMWQAIAPPALGTASNIYKGLGDIMEGNFADGIAKATPRYVAAAAKAYKLADKGVTTKEGNVRIPADEFGAAEIVAQSLGLPLLDVRKYYEREIDFNELEKAKNTTRTKLLKEWVETGERPDGVDHFNEKYSDARLTFKDVVSKRKSDMQYQRQVREDGLKVGKKQQSIAGEIRY